MMGIIVYLQAPYQTSLLRSQCDMIDVIMLSSRSTKEKSWIVSTFCHSYQSLQIIQPPSTFSFASPPKKTNEPNSSLAIQKSPNPTGQGVTKQPFLGLELGGLGLESGSRNFGQANRHHQTKPSSPSITFVLRLPSATGTCLSFSLLSLVSNLHQHPSPFDGHFYSAPIPPEQCRLSSEPDGIRRHDCDRQQTWLFRRWTYTAPAILPPGAAGL